MIYRLINYQTNRLIAEFPENLFSNGWGALHSAQRQARRHADGGTPVLLMGCDEPILYLPPGATRESLSDAAPMPCEVRHFDDPGRGKARRRRPPEQLSLPLEESVVA